MNLINKKTPFIFLLLAIVIQLMLWVGIYLLMNLSFCSEPKLSEEITCKISSYFMAIGGASGIIFSALGIYCTILNKRLLIILSTVSFLFLPVLFISTVNFYGFLILNAIL